MRLDHSIREIKRHDSGSLMRILKTQDAYIDCRPSLIWADPAQDAGCMFWRRCHVGSKNRKNPSIVFSLYFGKL